MKTFILSLGFLSVLAYADTARDQPVPDQPAHVTSIEFHEKMAGCLKSGKTSQECRREAAPDYSWDNDDMHDSCWHGSAHASGRSCC